MNIGYFLKTAFSNIRKNSLMSIASVSVLVACLVILGSAMLFSVNVNAFIDEVEDKNEVVIFIDDVVDEAGRQDIETKILATPNVTSCTFVSKEQAYEKYLETFPPEDREYLREQKNPLRDELHVKVTNLDTFDATVYSLEQIKGVAKIRNAREFVDSVVRIRSFVSMLSLWICGILLVVSIFIISNTVRLAMSTRSREINIMKYVGATNNFIRFPFFFEGAILGIVAGLVNIIIEYYIYSYLFSPLFQSLKMFDPIPFVQIRWYVVGISLAFGLVCGVSGAIFPIKKYLKV